MGREVRRVPKGWVAPLGPHFDETFEEAMESYTKARINFENGLNDEGKPLSEAAKGYSFQEWHGDIPDREYYREAFTEPADHYMLYETVSEGTSMSPAFATEEELAAYCAKEYPQTGDIERDTEIWLAMVKEAYAPSMMVTVSNTGQHYLVDGSDVPYYFKKQEEAQNG